MRRQKVLRLIAVATTVGALSPLLASAQPPITYKAAVVALAGDPQLRASFEEALVAKGREHNYDAVTSYDLVPDVTRVDDKRFVRRLEAAGIRAVLMMRPAAIGAGSTLESVRNEVPANVYSDMRAFASRVSPSQPDDLVAVVHMAVYAIADGRADLISAGAVWLEDPVENREQGITRLQDLIVANLDKARPMLRQRLGLPPLAP